MPLVSMTGFGEARGAHGALRWRWETRSVTGRGCVLRFRVLSGFKSIGPGGRTLVAERLRRGSVQTVRRATSEEPARVFRVDAAALADAVKIAKRIADKTGLPAARV